VTSKPQSDRSVEDGRDEDLVHALDRAAPVVRPLPEPERMPAEEAGHKTPDVVDAFDDRMALFLDVDGTLIDIAIAPDAVVVPPELPGHLRRVAMRLGGALALVSGRAIAALDRLFPALGCAVAGQHGAEMRDADGSEVLMTGAMTLPPAVVAAVESLSKRYPGVVIEPKGVTMAAHFRLEPDHGPALAVALAEILKTSHAPLELIPGKFVFEIAPKAVNKGRAIEHFMRQPPFAHRRPVFIGDDVTDEDGFVAVTRMGGLAIRVGEGGTGNYDHRVASAAWVRGWLRAAAKSGVSAHGHGDV